MRVCVFLCLLATSLAAPQGYSYQQQQQGGSFSIGLPQIATTSHQQASSSYQSSQSQSVAQEGHNFLQQAIQSPKVQQTILGGGQQSYVQRPQHSIIPQSFGIAPQQQPQQQSFQQQSFQTNYNRPSPVVTKDIYVHVAPEEPEEKFAQVPQYPPPPPRKHYRIVFIKAPTPKISSSAALRLQQAPSEEKTIIYVLTKKPDPLELETAFQDVAPKQPSKPEVYFIKYKTQEEAQHAQRTIQAQYDKLGGTTQISDEGVAPVTSVIGALDQAQQQSAGAGAGSVGQSYGAPLTGGNVISSNAPDSKYLPSIVRL